MRNKIGLFIGPFLVLLLTAYLMPCSRFYEDDFIQLGTLDGTVEGYGSAPFHLYGFMNGDTDQVRMAKESGPLPWFFPDRFRVNFFRPLSSLLLSVDHSVWGHRPAGYQAVTMVWYLAIVVLLGAVLRTVLADSPGRGWGVSVIASVLFVMNGSH